jgi:hypothetical protein
VRARVLFRAFAGTFMFDLFLLRPLPLVPCDCLYDVCCLACAGPRGHQAHQRRARLRSSTWGRRPGAAQEAPSKPNHDPLRSLQCVIISFHFSSSVACHLQAAAKGVEPGDIIFSIGGTRVSKNRRCSSHSFTQRFSCPPQRFVFSVVTFLKLAVCFCFSSLFFCECARSLAPLQLPCGTSHGAIGDMIRGLTRPFLMCFLPEGHSHRRHHNQIAPLVPIGRRGQPPHPFLLHCCRAPSSS